MSRKIFRHTFFVAMTLVLTMMAILTITTYSVLDREIISELEYEMDILSAGVNIEGEDYLKALDIQRRRITLIDTDGSVLFDSREQTDPEQSYKNNPGFISAVETGESWHNDYNSRWTVERVVHAQKLPDGSVLRIAARKDSILSLFLNFSVPFLVLFLIAIILSFLLSQHASYSIVTPINKLNLVEPLENDTYEEIRPLLERIAEQQKHLRASLENRMLETQQRHTEFDSAVSHEMRTPLTSISGFAELMRDESLSSAQVKEYAGIIYEEANRLLVLQKNLMSLMHLEDQSAQYEFEKTDLLELGTKALDSLTLQAKRYHITLQIKGDPVYVLAVKEILYEMILNLCDNAVKYNREGGQVELQIGTVDERPFLSVSDTGIGIPEEEQQYIFDRFYRVDKSRSRAAEGTGLGLSILAMGASLHHAEIEVRSKEGEGTSISLYFPESD